MAIKWKKWKSNLACVSFVLGVSLLITGGIGCLRWMRGNGGISSAWQLLTEEDYQNSKLFRNFIEGQLDNFLDMACGNAVFGYFYGDSGAYYYRTDEVVEEEAVAGELEAEAAYEGQIQQDAAASAGSADLIAQSESEDEWQQNLTEEQKKKSILNYHNAVKDDKNLLYSISRLDKELYTNRWKGKWSGKYGDMPEEFNFCLYFDGTKVTIEKDGEELDIYGDGVYREDSEWCVPGYRNFTAKTDWENVEIVLLAAKEPTPFLKSMDDRDIYGYGNGLYRVYREYADGRSLLFRTIFCMAAGLVLSALYLILRNGRGELNGRIAAFLANVWFEGKALAGLFLPIGLLFGILEREGLFYEMQAVYYYGETAFEYASELSDSLLYGLSGYPVAFLAAFWLFYLFVLDLCKNRGGYKNGIFGRLIARLDSREFALSVSGRMIRRTYLMVALTVVLLLYAFCLFGVSMIWDIPPVVLYWQMAAFVLASALLAAEMVFLRKNRAAAKDLERLAAQIEGIREGNYKAAEAPVMQDASLRAMAEELDDIRQGLGSAVEQRIKSERMKVELVANVSHDIKTPLTSIISYIQLLKQEEGLPGYVADYIRILDEKSERLKNMVQDVFAVSKAASGQLVVEYKELDLGKLLYQTLADMEELISASPVTVKTEIPKEPVTVYSDGQRMYRVFQNLIGNAMKYSLQGSRVYIVLKEKGPFAVASIKNTSSRELDRSVDFAERFTRGDESRTDGGSGLGLSIAKSFTEACGGTFELEINADLFVVTVSLPTQKEPS